MRIDRMALIRGLAAAASRERARRQAVEEARHEEAREWLLAELDQMAERARAAPGWREPTAEERQENLAYLEAWFREHDYPGAASGCAELRQEPDAG